MSDRISIKVMLFCGAVLPIAAGGITHGGEPPAPTLETVFPPGAAAGRTSAVEITGKALSGLQELHASIPGFRCRVLDGTRCDVTIPAETLPGLYDVWAVSENGISSPRTFAVSRGQELQESSANDSPETATEVSLNCIVNGRIEQPGDLDYFRFEARQGERVVLECWAERIDSRLRAILEVFDATGQRLAANRGYHGIDPLIDFCVPADGTYLVKIHDLVFSGGADYAYRLEIDSGPRIAFTVPAVIPRGQKSRVKVFGWNLPVGSRPKDDPGGDWEQCEVEIPAEMAEKTWPLPFHLRPSQVGLAGIPYHFPGSQSTIFIGVADVPVHLDQDDHHQPKQAQLIPVPCEVSGSLVSSDEPDWFAIDALRGEVLYFEVLSHRLGAPTDPQLSVWDSTGTNLLAEWDDELQNRGGNLLPTSHVDPSGRWVAPADGRYLVLVRDLNSGPQRDLRRYYRLGVRREEPDFQLVTVPRSEVPGGFNVRKGGRFAFDVLALRQRGLRESIRVSAEDLPVGIECPEIVLGPGVDRGTMVISADSSAADQLFLLKLAGHAESAGRRRVSGSTVVRTGDPHNRSRLTSEIPLAVAGESPVRLTAAVLDRLHHHLYGELQLHYSPGSVLDVTVRMDQRDANHQPGVRLRGEGLPPEIPNSTARIPAGERRGAISFCLPPTLPPGHYSIAIAGETSVPAPNGNVETVTVISNPVTFSVEPAAFQVDVAPFTPRRVKRGETFQVDYTAVRRNGFIGKIHTELAIPGVVTDVPGLRGRGVTFVGPTEQGSIQIVVNDDAPLGSQPFLRLFGVGVLEDEPTYYGAALLPLEIVE